MGRPLLLNEHTARSIIEAVAAGLPHDVAAHRAGVSGSTLASWLRRGRSIRDNPEPNPCPTCAAETTDPCRTATGQTARNPHAGRYQATSDDQRYLTFLMALERAESDAHAEAMLTIRNAWGSKWQAAAWYLERKYPERYGRRRVEVSGPDQEPVAVVVSQRDSYDWIMKHAPNPGDDPEAIQAQRDRAKQVARDMERNPMDSEQLRRLSEAGFGEGLTNERIVELLLRDVPRLSWDGCGASG